MKNLKRNQSLPHAMVVDIVAPSNNVCDLIVIFVIMGHSYIYSQSDVSYSEHALQLYYMYHELWLYQ